MVNILQDFQTLFFLAKRHSNCKLTLLKFKNNSRDMQEFVLKNVWIPYLGNILEVSQTIGFSENYFTMVYFFNQKKNN